MCRQDNYNLLLTCQCVPTRKTAMAKSKSFSYVASCIWNKVPCHFSSTSILPASRKRLKHHLVSSAFPSISSPFTEITPPPIWRVPAKRLRLGDSLQNSRLHTGKRVNFVLLPYLLSQVPLDGLSFPYSPKLLMVWMKKILFKLLHLGSLCEKRVNINLKNMFRVRFSIKKNTRSCQQPWKIIIKSENKSENFCNMQSNLISSCESKYTIDFI